MSNIFEVLPNFYISTGILSGKSGNIISINNKIESIDDNEVLCIDVDIDKMLINSASGSNLNINYDQINNFIINSYKQNKDVIIMSENLNVSVIICINFLMTYLDFNILEAIYYLCKKMNLNYKMIPENVLYNLFMSKK